MNFWDDFNDRVSKGAKALSQKSGEFFEIAKLKLNIASEKDKIGRLYEEIGRMVYEDFKQGSLKEKRLTDKCRLIDEAFCRISQLDNKVMQRRGDTLCKGCGEAVDSSQLYCHICGKEIKNHSKVVAEGEGYKVEISNGAVCGECGALIQETAEFCPACGKKI